MSSLQGNEIDFIKFLLSYKILIFFVINFSYSQKKKNKIFLKRLLEKIRII